METSNEDREQRPDRVSPSDKDMIAISIEFKNGLWDVWVFPPPAWLGERVGIAIDAACQMLKETLNGRDGEAAYLHVRLPNWRCEWTEQTVMGGGLGWVATYKGDTPDGIPYVVEIANATLVNFAWCCLRLEHDVAEEFRREKVGE